MTALDQVDPASGDVQFHTYDASKKPPPFGHAIKPYWAFEKDYVNLNHGSYGSAPLPILFKCQELTVLAERNPDKFHRFTYMPLLEEARQQVADIVGANVDEIVLVPNATHGINTVLRNLEWREGDVILGATTTYGAVSRTIRYLADRSEQPRPLALAIEYTFPMTHAEILDKFRTRIKEIKNTYPNVAEFIDCPSDSPMYVDGAEKKNKFVAVIDSITSNPGVLMPWKEMVRICKEEGVWSVVDGAHSIGQEMNLNLSTEAKPDFFVSNCHKWFYAKRGCALLYVPKRNQHLIKSSIPTSHEYVSPNDPNSPAPADTHFVKQHEWTGTTDEVPYLSVTAAVEFRKWLGGEVAINTYCHKLALDGGQRLAEVLGTKVLDETGQLTLSMTNVLLPLPVEESKGEVYSVEALYKIYGILREKQLYEWNTYAAHYFHAGGWWCRCSAQVWNEVSDFEYLGKAFNAICKEIKETVLAGKE